MRIHTAGGQIEAESLRAELLEANISCQLDGAPNIGMPGLTSGWNMASIGVLISESDQSRAQEVIEQWRASLPKRPAPPKIKFQYGLKWVFVVITVTAVFCMLAKTIGASGVYLLLGSAAFAVQAALMIFGYMRKHHRHKLDD